MSEPRGPATRGRQLPKLTGVRHGQRRAPHHAAIAGVTTFGTSFPGLAARSFPMFAAADSSEHSPGQSADADGPALEPSDEALGDVIGVERIPLDATTGQPERLLGVVGEPPGGTRPPTKSRSVPYSASIRPADHPSTGSPSASPQASPSSTPSLRSAVIKCSVRRLHLISFVTNGSVPQTTLLLPPRTLRRCNRERQHSATDTAIPTPITLE